MCSQPTRGSVFRDSGLPTWKHQSLTHHHAAPWSALGQHPHTFSLDSVVLPWLYVYSKWLLCICCPKLSPNSGSLELASSTPPLGLSQALKHNMYDMELLCHATFPPDLPSPLVTPPLTQWSHEKPSTAGMPLSSPSHWIPCWALLGQSVSSFCL